MMTLSNLIAVTEQALKDYQQALDEKWEYRTLVYKNMCWGLCAYYEENGLEEMSDFIAEALDEVDGGITTMWGTKFLCERGRDYTYSHHERFYPRIVFLKTLLDELRK